MLELLFCGYNLSCHFRTIDSFSGIEKYPKDHYVVCQYFDENKLEKPEYCYHKHNIKQPRRRSEF